MIADHIIDKIQFTWLKSQAYNGPRIIECPKEFRILQSFLGARFWESCLRFMHDAVLAHHGITYGDSGFHFPDDLAPEYEEYEGVRFFDPIDEIIISEKAFDRLMNRYFQVILEGTPKFKKELLEEEWWPKFEKNARALEERVKMQS